MRHIRFTLLFALAFTVSSLSQTQTPPPQTARQALIEMFVGKNPGDFEKHLPEMARQSLIRKGQSPEASMVQKIAMIARQFTAGRGVETFDVGQMLLVSEQNEGREKVEVTVEHDYLTGEQDEIELSIHVYHNGSLEFLPVIPRLTFSLTQEKDIWRLTEATLAARMPLTDPDYLKGLRQKEDESNENMASATLNTMIATEVRYASQHPERGYTCNPSDLFGKIDSASMAAQTPEGPTSEPLSQDSNGYHFSFSGCEGSPATKFRVIAVPAESDAGMRTFCSDESGLVKFQVGGKSGSCFIRGQILNRGLSNPIQPE